ncbi:MAG: aldo/keto reductase [Cyclobacteriaceae bacterium]
MRYKLLGRSGLRVSEICLGTMTFGEDWGWGAGKEESRKIFEDYLDAGGNFIDTANRYTEGTSEKYVGEFIAESRESLVVATKYSLYNQREDPNAGGNHRKNLVQSVEASLKRLNTDYIDLLWLHAWDSTTPVDEVMRGLDDLVRAGKVLYLGISDTPAWVVSQANTMAEIRGWSRFVALQVEYSLVQRSAEREYIPMSKAFDLAITPWAPLAGGVLTGKYLNDDEADGRVSASSDRRNSRNTEIAEEVVTVAEELNVTPAQVALRWTMQKDFLSIPIIGARKLSQLQDSLKCLRFELPDMYMERLDKVSEIQLGFPHDFLNSEGVKDVLFGGTYDMIDNHRL